MSDPFSDETIHASLRNSIVAGFVGVFFFMVVQNGPIPLLLEQLGAGGVVIGLTAALFQLGMIVQIPSASFAEGLTRSKPFWAFTTIFARAVLLIPGVFLLVAPDSRTVLIWLVLGAIGLFSFVAQMSAPSWFSWMAELVPEKRRARFWSTRQGMMMGQCCIGDCSICQVVISKFVPHGQWCRAVSRVATGRVTVRLVV